MYLFNILFLFSKYYWVSNLEKEAPQTKNQNN